MRNFFNSIKIYGGDDETRTRDLCRDRGLIRRWPTHSQLVTGTRVGVKYLRWAWLGASCATNCATILLVFSFLYSPAFAQQKQEQPRTFRVPFHSLNGLILLDAEVEGKPATFLFDTGAGRTIVSVEASPVLRWHRNETLQGQAVQVMIGLRLGDFLTLRPFATMNLDAIEKQMRTRFDGLLGQDVLREFSAVRIDYKNHIVELELGPK